MKIKKIGSGEFASKEYGRLDTAVERIESGWR